MEVWSGGEKLSTIEYHVCERSQKLVLVQTTMIPVHLSTLVIYSN